MASDHNMVAVHEDQEARAARALDRGIDWDGDGPDLSDDDVFAAWLRRHRRGR